MTIDQDAAIEITAFDWVPDFARGFVRDLRPRWACEEIGLAYSERLLSGTGPRPQSYYREQPWGQVPVLKDTGLHVFESGAILLHLGEKDARLLPTGPQARETAICWLFAAYNSVEPLMFELSNVDIFAEGEEWARLRRPSLLDFAGQRFDRLADALGGKDWFAGDFSIADIAMATVLREAGGTDLVSSRPNLAAYVERATTRPAFQRALAAQLAAFDRRESRAA